MAEQISRSKNKAAIGLVLIVVSALLFILTIIPNFAVTKFFLGVFGIAWYGYLAFVLLLGSAFAMKRKYAYTAKFTTLLCVAIFSIVTLLHVIFSTALADMQGFDKFSEYLSSCYNATNGLTVGGIVSGIFAFFIRNVFGMIGVYCVLVMMVAIFVGIVLDNLIYGRAKKQQKVDVIKQSEEHHYEEVPTGESAMINTSLSREEQEENELEPIMFDKPEETPASKSVFSNKTTTNEYINPAEPIGKSSREIARNTLFGNRAVPDITLPNDQERDEFMRNYRSQHESEIEKENIETEDEQDDISNLFGSSSERTDSTAQKYQPSDAYRRNFPQRSVSMDDIRRATSQQDEIQEESEDDMSINREPRRISTTSDRTVVNIDHDINLNEEQQEERPISAQRVASPRNIDLGRSASPIQDSRPEPQKQVAKQIGMKAVRYNAIPISIFEEYSETQEDHSEEYRRKSAALEKVMNEFGIAAKVINVVRGPKVTRYEMSLPAGISTTKVTSIQNNISMALEARSMIRIEAPIPGKNAIGIELENDKATTVGMRELLESKEFVNFKDPLPIAIGKDINGAVIIKSLPKLVHALVAGSTGSGKSVFIHSVVMSILYKYSPDQVRFIMIDPKRVEFTLYNNLPHLLFPNVLVDHDKALNALKWAVAEMMRRYDTMNQNECRNIEGYNSLPDVKSGKLEKMPYIIIVVDELAELMGGSLKKDFEGNIQRIAQLGRASGIHMVVATQRPSVDVVPGTIKNNFPTRVAFALSSSADSKTILDEGGAESLLGKGDMLFAPQDSNRKIRLQAAFCTDAEIMNAVKYVKANNQATYNEDIMKEVYATKEEETADDGAGASGSAGRNNGMDEYMKLAVDYARASGTVSSSVLQRKFHIGYNRAASIVDQMIEFGWVGPPNGSKPREFKIPDEQYKELFGEEDDGLL